VGRAIRRRTAGVSTDEEKPSGGCGIHESAAGDDQPVVRAALHVHRRDEPWPAAGNHAGAAVAQAFMKHVRQDMGNDSDACCGHRVGVGGFRRGL